jgi:hypothetical protein
MQNSCQVRTWTDPETKKMIGPSYTQKEVFSTSIRATDNHAKICDKGKLRTCTEMVRS